MKYLANQPSEAFANDTTTSDNTWLQMQRLVCAHIQGLYAEQ